MTDRLHVAAVVAAVTVIIFIVRLVRTRQLRAKYSVLWLSVGLGVVVLAVVAGAAGHDLRPPRRVLRARDAVHGRDRLPGLLVLHFSWELSRLEDRTRTLAEEVAILAERVTRLAGDSETTEDTGVPDR